ncbi:helix-turn-helix domain-containing protein [Sphaerisporangium aureirubrum]|uniref:Helix-turn-helix domain-containing protein n=1 Tax=Sphaerisporangium aureirubrum TaxID=1544736 RepID=A0ABW1NBR1_9ACTN
MPAPRKNSDRYRSMAHYFGALIRDLRDSYETRIGEPMTVARLADRAGYSVSMIGQLERGESLPESGQRVQALDDALRAGGELRKVWPLVQRLGHRTIDELAAATNRAIGGYRDNQSGVLLDGDDMERRHLFQLAGLGLLTQGSLSGTGEPIRLMLERALGTAHDLTVEDWEAVCAGHMQAVLHQPPARVRDQLAVDLAAVRQELLRTASERASGLARVAAWLSVMYANVLWRIGEHGAGQRWLVTARHAADVSSDLDMRVWARETEAMFALYSPLPGQAVLEMARNAQAIAGTGVTPVRMRAVAMEAQALAVLGRGQEAQERLLHLYELVDRRPAAERFSWTDDAVWFTASWVHSYGGAIDEAREARDNALALVATYQNSANIQLHEALSVSKSGRHDKALAIATQVISDLDPAHRTYPILHTARSVLATVPVEKRRALPALPDYRAAISAAAPG